MMFPPPIISEPPPDDDQTDGVHISITAQDTVQEGREDQLADVDDGETTLLYFAGKWESSCTYILNYG